MKAVEALAALDALVQECYFPHHTPSSESGPEEWDVQIESPTLEALERAIRALAALESPDRLGQRGVYLADGRELKFFERAAFELGARREMLEFAIALADDRLNKRGDPIACHIYLVNALEGVALSDELQDEARALLEARDDARAALATEPPEVKE